MSHSFKIDRIKVANQGKELAELLAHKPELK
jgi:hypothetical protein